MSDDITTNYSQAVHTARDYYNSEDADHFYSAIWGGEDIHIGLYQSESEDIPTASQRTVQTMAEQLGTLNALNANSSILDIGSGYCGSARYLAKHFDCPVTALNLSEKENERARILNNDCGLGNSITVIDGSFEDIPAENNSFDVVWSQDAILHSGHRDTVLKEVARVMKPGGHFIFTDPMQADNCPDGVLKPILNRIHLDTLGSPKYYRETASQFGLEIVQFEDRTDQLVRHYSRVLEETEKRQQEITQTISADYVERMKAGLKHWINGGKNGHLAWGIFLFRKQ